MKRLTRFQENISVRKATNYAIIINSLEILLILGVMTLVVISPQYDFSPRMVRLLVGVAAAVIIWGAVMDIREAMSTRRLLSQLDAMDDTIDAMEKLNNTLRAQRHDFLNHLQVVYSLMEMEEYSTITLTENLKEYVFSVANTGTSIPPDDQQRIFEPGVTTKSDGHGMGLFIVRETLRHYGGDIQVTSDAQETVFSGTVPKDTTIPEAKAAQENSPNT